MPPLRLLAGSFLALSLLAGCTPAPVPDADDAPPGPSPRRLVVPEPAVPGGTLTLQLASGPAFTAATTGKLILADDADTLPLEVVARQPGQITFAWPVTACGRFRLGLGDDGQLPAVAPIEVEVEVTDGCVPPPVLTAVRPAVVRTAAGRWTTVHLEGRNLEAGDRVTLEHPGDPRIAPAGLGLRYLSAERLALEVPAELRCADWLVTVERPGIVTPPARATLDWCPMNTLNVLSYNVAMVPAVGLPWLQPWLPFPTAACEPLCWTKGERAPALAGHPALLGFDVVVLQELFSRAHRRTILDGLRRAPAGYPEAGRMVPGNWPFAGGGVVILSRWPIEAEARERFAACAGGIRDTALASRNDCLANKGVVYAAIRKAGRRYHIFGTHLDAGQGPADHGARELQLQALAAFIQRQRIPATEPVIIAGDLNIERFDPTQRRRLGEVLKAAYGPFSGCSPAPHPTTPAGSGLDYVLYSQSHLLPLGAETGASDANAATSRIICPTTAGQNLSDHYAVLGSFVFPPQP